MWILMEESYAGPAGLFNRGQKYDLMPAIIEQLPKSSYKKTCAPWDENKDETAIALSNARAQVNANENWLELTTNKLAAAQEKSQQLITEAEAKEKEAIELRLASDAAAKKADKEAARLAAQKAERARFEFSKANGRAQTAEAEVSLLEMDVEDARQRIETAAGELEALKAKAEKKAKTKKK